MTGSTVLMTGFIIFFARICDVSFGTVRTIVTVQGRTVTAFFMAVFEVTIWVLVINAVIGQMDEQPLLVIFYALGYATGNVVGIKVEEKLAFGLSIVRVFCKNSGNAIAGSIRSFGQPVTMFVGEGMQGPVCELYIACRRKDLQRIINEIRKEDDQAFYVVEQAKTMNRVLPSVAASPSKWPMGGMPGNMWRSALRPQPSAIPAARTQGL